MSTIIYIKEVDLTSLPPVSKLYFERATGMKHNRLYNWLEKKKILTDKNSGDILFSEILRIKEMIAAENSGKIKKQKAA